MTEKKRPITDTIPKLDKIEYVFDALARLNEGATLDQVRIGMIETRREIDAATRADLRSDSQSRVVALRVPGPDTFWTNARDALRELMRLGMAVKAPVPRIAAEFMLARDRVYELTDVGREFLAIDRKSPREFRDRFFCAMFTAHPYLRATHRLLVEAPMFIPHVARKHLPDGPAEWLRHPPEIPTPLVDEFTAQIAQFADRNINSKELSTRFATNVANAWSSRPPRGSHQKVASIILKTANDQLTRTVAQMLGLRMDHITFRHTRSILSDLDVAWSTRSLPSHSGGLKIWLTADGDAPVLKTDAPPAVSALRNPVWLRRRRPEDTEIVKAVVEAILHNPNQAGGFSLIHEIRAAVCDRLRIHGRIFAHVLMQMVAGDLKHSSYAVHIDAGGGADLPRAEDPFILERRAFYLITAVKRSES